MKAYERPAAWSRRVVSNLVIDRFRSRRSGRAALGRADVVAVANLDGSATRSEREPTSGASPERQLEEWLSLLRPLTPRQRAIATLYDAEDESRRRDRVDARRVHRCR